MSLEQKIKTALKWSAIGKIITQLSKWVLTLWTIRILSPDDYGLFALAMLVISLFSLINEFGLGPALVAEEDLDKEKICSTAGFILTMNLTICSIIFLAAPYLAMLLDDSRLTLIIQVISVQFVFGALNVVPRSLLVRNLDFKRKETVLFIKNISAGISTLGFALAGYGVWALVWGNLISLLIETVLLNLKEFYLPSFNFSKVKSMMNFGANIITQRVVWWVYNEADIIILNRILSTNLVGSYYAAKNLASLPGEKTGQLINEIVFSGFSKIRDNSELVTKSLTRALKVLSFLMFPIYFGISAVSDELIVVVLGEKWIDSIVPLQILCLVFAFRILNVPLGEVLNALKQTKIQTQNTFILSVIILVSLIVGSNWGLLGVCYAWCVGYLISTTIVTIRSAPYTGITLSILFGTLIRPLICCLIMYLCIYMTRMYFLADTSEFVSLIILIITGIITYIPLVLLLDKETVMDIKKFGFSRG